MNNEPVAWININVDAFNGKPTLSFDKDEFAEITTPLYTHPVKELTDEEIEIIANKDEFWKDHGFDEIEFKYLDFAKAILRKAQEK